MKKQTIGGEKNMMKKHILTWILTMAMILSVTAANPVLSIDT